MSFTSLLKKILNSGVRVGSDPVVARPIFLLNALSFSFFVIVGAYFFVFYFAGLPTLAWLALGLASCYPINIVANHFGQKNFARWAFILLSNASVLIFSGFLGDGLRIQYFFFTASLLPAVVFPSENRVSIMIGVSVSVMAALYLEWVDYQLPGVESFVLSDFVTDQLRISVVLTTFLILFLIFFYVYLANQRSESRLQDLVSMLRTSERRLEKQTEDLMSEILDRKEAEKSLKLSQRELRELANKSANVQEKERARISREIHDELGQILTALKMDISWMEKRVPKDEENSQKFIKMKGLIDQTIDTVRRISAALRPSALDDLGLVAALENQVQIFRKMSGLDCRLETNLENLDLDESRSIAIYRIMQEALTNIARHAGAKSVVVKFLEKGSKVVLEVEDDGKGVDLKTIDTSQTMGLLGMRERAFGLNGNLEISSNASKGTIVKLEVPI